MSERNYSKQFRILVAREAAKPENQDMEHIIAEKYGIKRGTVHRWKNIFLVYGEDGLSHGKLGKSTSTPREIELEKENKQLREEVEILKKAAAFLANVKRD